MQAPEQLRVRCRRDQVGVSQDGELRLETQEIPFCRAIQLSLLSDRVASVTVGDVSGDRECGSGQDISRGLRLPPSALTDDAEDLAGKGDGFLPDLEVAYAGCHGGKMEVRGRGRWTRRLLMGSFVFAG